MKKPITIRDLQGLKGAIKFGATCVKPGEYAVHTLACHEGVHWDEVVEVFILKVYGTKFFREIANAKLRFAPRNECMDDAFAALQKGEIWLGCGDSPFNEHETASRGEISGHSAATVTAHLLGVERAPELHSLLADALASDRQPTMDAGHVHNVMKAMREGGASDEAVFAWATKAVEVIHLRQVNFHQVARKDFDSVGRIESVPTATSTIVPVAFIAADNVAFTRFALWKTPKGKGASVAVCMTGSGCLTVLLNTERKLPPWFLLELFRRLAVQHCKKLNLEIPHECSTYQYQDLPDNIGGLHLWREQNSDGTARFMGILNKDTPLGLTLDEVAAEVCAVIGCLEYSSPSQTSGRVPARARAVR